MVKEVNQNIFVNDWDYPDKGDHRCDDPEKKKLIEKLSKMITDSLDRKRPEGESFRLLDTRQTAYQRGSQVHAQLQEAPRWIYDAPAR